MPALQIRSLWLTRTAVVALACTSDAVLDLMQGGSGVATSCVRAVAAVLLIGILPGLSVLTITPSLRERPAPIERLMVALCLNFGFVIGAGLFLGITHNLDRTAWMITATSAAAASCVVGQIGEWRTNSQTRVDKPSRRHWKRLSRVALSSVVVAIACLAIFIYSLNDAERYDPHTIATWAVYNSSESVVQIGATDYRPSSIESKVTAYYKGSPSLTTTALLTAGGTWTKNIVARPGTLIIDIAFRDMSRHRQPWSHRRYFVAVP